MTFPVLWQPFRAELRDAVVRNLDLIERGEPSSLLDAFDEHMRAHDAAKRAAQWLIVRAPYTFDPALPACAVDECLQRGFTACADAAALAAAVAFASLATTIEACVRTRAVPYYAHVVLFVDGVEVDPYAFRALPHDGSPCAARWSVRDDIVPR